MLTSNQKSVIQGLTLVSFIILMNFAVLTIYGVMFDKENTSDTDDVLYRDPLFTSESFEWDVTSALSLASNIENRSPNLLHVSFSSSIIDDLITQDEVTCSDENDEGVPCEGDGEIAGWAGHGVAILNYNITSFLAYVNEDNENWYLTINRPVPYDEFFAIDDFLLNDIHSAFTSDFDQLENFTDLDNFQDKQYIKVGDLVIHIRLIYNDGSLLSIQSVGSTIFINLDRCKKYIGTFTMMGCETDQTFEEIEYYANSIHQFPNYISALNDILDEVIIGV